MRKLLHDKIERLSVELHEQLQATLFPPKVLGKDQDRPYNSSNNLLERKRK